MRALILDYNGPLVDGTNFTEKRSKRVAKLFGVSWNREFMEYWKKQYVLVSSGKISLQDYYTQIGSTLGVPVPPSIDEQFLAGEQLSYPEVVQDLEALKDKFGSSLKIGIVSNYVESWVLWFLQQHNIKRHFREIVVSDKAGVRKPSAGIYEKILFNMKLHGGECVYVADERSDLEATKKLGMRCVFMKGEEQDVTGFPTISRLNEVTKYL